MKLLISITILVLSQFAIIGNAGSLNGGEWIPTNCGEKPVSPVVDDHDVKALNKSIKAINDWQHQAKTYYECLINDANTDNGLIVDKANRAQTEYKQTFDELSTSVDAAEKKLEKK